MAGGGPAQSDDQGAWHAGGFAGAASAHQRWHFGQCHLAVFGRYLCRGGRGLDAGFGSQSALGRVAGRGGQCGKFFHQPNRCGGGCRTREYVIKFARRQGCHGQCSTGLCAFAATAIRYALAALAAAGCLGAATAMGQHRYQESCLCRDTLCRGSDRSAYRQHHAACDIAGLCSRGSGGSGSIRLHRCAAFVAGCRSHTAPVASAGY